MKRYFVKPCRLANINDEVDGENYLSRTVYEPDGTPFETGILDANGRMIMASYSLGPIGFIQFAPTDE